MLLMITTGRYRLWAGAGLALALVWALALIGFRWARHERVTADKVIVFLQEIDLSRLSGEARTRALQELARRLNQLSMEERRKARMAGAWDRWLSQMTDDEKADFLQATLPVGVQQMIASFEQQPEEKRRKMIDDAWRRLQEARNEAQRQPGETGPDPAVFNEELRRKIAETGLQVFYSQSSARTKAELAPFLEELQHTMQGTDFRGLRPHGPHP
jgi:hypothetical protein